MAQVFTSSADIGGAIRPRGNISNAPYVTGYRVDSTSVTTGSTGAWPLPMAGGFIPVQPLIPLTVTTSSPGVATYTYIPTATGSLSSAAGPSIAGGGNNTFTTGYQVAGLAFDTNANRLWIWNPVSSAWLGSVSASSAFGSGFTTT